MLDRPSRRKQVHDLVPVRHEPVGDMRAVATFSRHKDLRTLSRYHDNRSDLAGKVAALVAAE